MRASVPSLLPGLLMACGAATARDSHNALARRAPTEPTAAAGVRTAPPRVFDPLLNRLRRLAVVWGDVRFQHPYLYERDIDWDAALVRALPAVEAATTEDDEAAAVATMLATLGDPVTRVEARTVAADASIPPRESTFRTVGDVTVFTLGTVSNRRQADALADEAWLALKTAKAAVIDLRGAQDRQTILGATGFLEMLSTIVVTRDVAAPAMRWVQHDGFATQTSTVAGEFATYFGVEPGTLYRPGPAAHAMRLAFICDETLGIPPSVAALTAAGDARLLFQGDVRTTSARWTESLPLGEHHVVTIRRAVVSNPDPDATVHDPARAVEEAILLLGRPRPALQKSTSPAGVTFAPHLERDASYRDEALPTREHRVLAAFRAWNVIRLFYPYKELLAAKGDWNDVLPEMLPLFTSATTPLAYQQAVSKMAARIPDGHVWVQGMALREWRGSGGVGAEVRQIERQPVIVSVGEVAAQAGLRVGDVLLDIANEPFASRANRFTELIADSNPWTLVRDSYSWALSCPKETSVPVRVRGTDGQARVANVSCAGHPYKSTAPTFRLLGDDIGYVDLGRLESGDVEPMFAALGKTRGLVFDMRGYPTGTTIAIAEHLTTHAEPVAAARIETPLLSPRPPEATSKITLQWLPPPSPSHYAGRTVMLIDERTQSAAEHTGLFFEAANGTTFIGSPSAGANGDTTEIALPGKVSMSFSGLSVSHADGRPLQGVGLQPTVQVRPTLAGIRAGRDEVLEAAITDLRRRDGDNEPR